MWYGWWLFTVTFFQHHFEGKPLIEPSVPAAASRAAAPLGTTRWNRIEPMEEEDAVGELEEEEEGEGPTSESCFSCWVGLWLGWVASRDSDETGAFESPIESVLLSADLLPYAPIAGRCLPIRIQHERWQNFCFAQLAFCLQNLVYAEGYSSHTRLFCSM